MDFKQSISIKNKKASFNFELLEEFETGIVLKGSEIKSIRLGKVSLEESYCYYKKNALWIKNLRINPYENGGFANHDPEREKKLLLKKQELGKIQNKLKDQSLTLVPKKLFINSRGLAKMIVALARGKKMHDKRQSLKEKDIKREIARSGY